MNTLTRALARLSLALVAALAFTAGVAGEAFGADGTSAMERPQAAPLTLSIDWYEGYTGHSDGGAGAVSSAPAGRPLALGRAAATGAGLALLAWATLHADADTAALGVALATAAPALPEEATKALDELRGNIKRVLELEGQIKEGVEAGKGVADLKQEVANLSTKNAELVDAAKKEVNDRLDEMEAKAKERGLGGAAVKTAGELFVESEDFTGSAQKAAMGWVNVDRPAVERGAAKAVTLGTNATPPNYIGEVVRPQDVRRAMRDLIPGGRSAQNTVKYVKLTTRATAAAPVAAGAAKPESNLVLTDADAVMRKIAHYIIVNEEQLSDSDVLRSLIDAELEYGIELAEDTQILNGDGTGQNLNGIIPQATAYAAATYGSTVTNPTRIDHIRGMMAQLQVANYVPDGIVLHPIDWFKIETTKDADNAYIFARVQDAAGERMWGLPIAVTTQITADTGLVGAFRIGAQLFDGQLLGDYGIFLKVGYPNDLFLKNQLAVLAEERLTLAVKRPGAFVTGDLTPA